MGQVEKSYKNWLHCRAMHPDYPIVEGHYQLTSDWSLVTPLPLNRRVEDGDLILWRPGFTIILAFWENEKKESIKERLKWLKDGTSPAAMNKREFLLGEEMSRFSYELTEDHDGQMVLGYYGFVIAPEEHVQFAVYLDEETELKVAKEIFNSIRFGSKTEV